ncbi:MAG: UDP-galactose-lipid carrier transferase [Acidimicrobiaceae bacterium]|nr:UDP-galactose-lipid carrier transferase [Acidimicrobiaceae bacterium]
MSDRVKDIDLSKKLNRQESEERVLAAQRRLTQLRLFTAGLLKPSDVGPGLIVIFEGFDAAGKGGAIRRLTAGLDPRHVRVVPVGPPTPEERGHHFLWRFQAHVPGRGEMTVFDRSWYGRLLVERVDEGLDTKASHRSADEIVEFERMLVNDGVTIVKLWLHISQDEQLRRFNDRANNPLKQWKLTPDDWHNRSMRPSYLEALESMVAQTDQAHAHWDLIGAEDKHYARVAVLETLISRWDHDLSRRGFEVPPAHGGDYLL